MQTICLLPDDFMHGIKKMNSLVRLCYRSALLDQCAAFQNMAPTLPKMQL